MDKETPPFRPPFCPIRKCRFHLDARGWRWIHFGFYQRRCEPRIIQRFFCCHCKHSFSTQTFSTTYYLKRPELQIPLFYRLLACSGYRQIAREARCNPTTVMGQAARLGRHALLALQHLRGDAPVLEPLVIDGFESFAFSQYHPLHLNLVIGAESHYLYGLSHSELRRKGRMSERQKKIRASLERTFGRPDPKAIELDMAGALKLASPEPIAITIRSDEHPAYPRAFRRLRGWTIRHEQTPSVAARTSRNPLFPANLADLLLRHSSANHKRETIAFSKRNQSVIERAAVLALWRNFTKPFSERHGGGTPAMRAAIASRPLPIRELLKERLFPDRVVLPEPWRDYYWRKVPTRRIRNPRLHDLVLAY
jgi:hypothetical protein